MKNNSEINFLKAKITALKKFHEDQYQLLCNAKRGDKRAIFYDCWFKSGQKLKRLIRQLNNIQRKLKQ